jgi:hypothetical protein
MVMETRRGRERVTQPDAPHVRLTFVSGFSFPAAHRRERKADTCPASLLSPRAWLLTCAPLVVAKISVGVGSDSEDGPPLWLSDHLCLCGGMWCFSSKHMRKEEKR